MDIAEHLIGISSAVSCLRNEYFAFQKLASAVSAGTAAASGVIGNAGSFQGHGNRFCCACLNDILLDASTSQKDRQETVSNQGYIIASALTRCGVPCRVMSFCSMTGYTILRIFRDYNRPQDNKRIFEYVSNGCNRDGLAIRAAHALMNRSPCEHRLLIILSDVKPNDIVRIPGAGEEERIPYEREAGVRDTAFEVRRARADGISVVCVFTGDDEDLPAARLVYGRDFARIQSLDKLADAVSKLIQNQIRLL